MSQWWSQSSVTWSLSDAVEQIKVSGTISRRVPDLVSSNILGHFL
jgi:hypothetical protein